MLAHVQKSGKGKDVEPVNPLNTREKQYLTVFQYSDQTLMKTIRRSSVVKLQTRHSFESSRTNLPHHFSVFAVKYLHLLNSRYTLLWERGDKLL
jgi:hypothetical protein